MKFEDVLPALRVGKCVKQEGHRFPWAYLKMVNGALHWHNFGPYRKSFAAELRAEELMTDNWAVVDEDFQQAAAPVGAHRCGRRGDYDETSPLHHAREGGLTPDYYEAEGRCSYCGSVSQEMFLQFVRDGGEVGPTDKNYKAYLHEVKNEDGTVKVRVPGIKFYFQHLDASGRAEFISLYNDKKMRIGYPGHFYRRPYFYQTVEQGVV